MDRVEILERELDRLLQWVRAAESRLALVLSLGTAMLGALAVSIPRAFEWSLFSAIAASFAVFLLVLSIVFSALATFPRTTGPKGSLIYFGGIASVEVEQFAKRMKALTEDEYIEDLTLQCHRNAQIATKKYGWVQKSMGCLFMSSPFWAIALFSLYVSK
jgi:hypothetical protein